MTSASPVKPTALQAFETNPADARHLVGIAEVMTTTRRRMRRELRERWGKHCAFPSSSVTPWTAEGGVPQSGGNWASTETVNQEPLNVHIGEFDVGCARPSPLAGSGCDIQRDKARSQSICKRCVPLNPPFPIRSSGLRLFNLSASCGSLETRR
jgi:hypothetical protein